MAGGKNIFGIIKIKLNKIANYGNKTILPSHVTWSEKEQLNAKIDQSIS